jgi:hypothetical protein
MLKKTSLISGMLIATAAGAVITSVPAFAQVPTDGGGGGGGCCSSNDSRHHFSDRHRNRSWNGNENDNFNRIRLRIHNRNNNIAVARTPQQRENRPIIVSNRDDEGR